MGKLYAAVDLVSSEYDIFSITDLSSLVVPPITYAASDELVAFAYLLGRDKFELGENAVVSVE